MEVWLCRKFKYPMWWVQHKLAPSFGRGHSSLVQGRRRGKKESEENI